MIQEMNALKKKLHLECDVHVVVEAEPLVAIGAFAQAGLEALFDALSAEDVSAGLDHCVLEIFPTYLT